MNLQSIMSICGQAYKKKSYDSVRGIFIEGELIYPESGIREKSHVHYVL